MKVFYDGMNYYGYQRQPSLPTIESHLISALKRTDHIDSAVINGFKGASRTDRYVSAIGNVFAFTSNKPLILGQINSELPKDRSIICWAYAEIDEDFSPRYSEWKKYWYILPKSNFEIKTELSLSTVTSLLKKFEGRHNFKLFARHDHRDANRTILSTKVFSSSEAVVLEYIAPSFLWEQIRRITAYVLNYPSLAPSLQDISSLLNCETRIHDLSLEPADPRNLILVEHFYPKIDWSISVKEVEKIQLETKRKLALLSQKVRFHSIFENYFGNIS